MNREIALAINGWFALWLTEVLAVKVWNQEEIPFFFYGAQALSVTTFFYLLFS